MRQTSRSIIAIALLAGAVAGASGLGLVACNSEPTCEKAADRVLELIDEQNEKMLAKFPESQRKQLAEITAKPLPRDRLVKDCQARFTKEQIACTVAAKSLEDASKCNQAATPTGDTPTPTGGTPTPTGGTPTPTGGTPTPTGGTPTPTGAEPTPATPPAQPSEGATPGTAGDSEAAGAAPQAPAAGEPAQPSQPQ